MGGLAAVVVAAAGGIAGGSGCNGANRNGAGRGVANAGANAGADTVRADAPVVISGASCARLHTGGTAPVRLGGAMTGSTVELARWGERTVAFVADEDARAIVVVDVDSQKTLSVTRTEGRPAQVLLLPDGRLAVALRDAGKLGIFERAANATYALEARCGVPAPADPVGLALEPRSARLLVASAWGHALTSFDAGTLERQDTIELAREPRSVVVSADGTTAFVAHAVGGRLSVVDLPSRKVQRVALTSLHDHDLWTIRERVVDRLGGGAVALPNKDLLAELLKDELADLNGRSRGGFGARTSCQGFALARTELPGGRIFAPQVFVDPGNREERTAGYGAGLQHTEVPSIAVLDDATGVPLAVSLRLGQDVHIQGHVTDLPEPCILPRAAVVDARSQQLLVSCLGIDTVIAYDAKSGDPVHAETRRWRVPAGPTGLAIDPVRKRAVVWSQFDRALSIIPLDASDLETEEGKDDAAVARIDLGRGTNDGGTHDGGMRGGSELTVELALGRSLFHASGDGRISNDGRACASCHPDGRDDGLVWATPNGPRRTKQLGGMLRGTAPFSWDGSAPDVHTHVVETFRRLAGKGGLRSLELRALIAYVESLDAPPIAAVSTDPKLARGAQIFASREAGCAGCHDGNARTDTRRHDITSRVTADRDAEFDTPSLRFVAGRAPYFHDGRYATLGALLAGTDGKMGHTAHLDEEQRAALEAYLSSL